jgi:hypothetical protein
MSSRSFSRWVSDLVLGQKKRPIQRKAPRFQPGMEHLEAREVPAIVLGGIQDITTTEGAPGYAVGTYTDTNGNSSTNFSASLGTVTRNASAGTWEWRHNATTELANVPVTITATNSFGDTETTQFTFTASDAALRATLTPTMKSVTADGTYLTNVAANAFDGKINTAWNAGKHNATINARFNGLQTATGVVLSVISAPNATETYTISTSKDGVNFTQLAAATRFVAAGSINALAPIEFAQPATFEYLRIAVNGGASWVSISEARLLAPTVGVTPPNVTEGEGFVNFPVFRFTDDNPGANISDYTATVELGDGNTVTLTSQAGPNGRIVANSAGGFEVQLSHTYADPVSNAKFSVSVVDVDSTISANSMNFSVANAPLTNVANVSFSAFTGVAFSGTVASFTDTEPGVTNPAAYTATIHWGDGTTTAGTIAYSGTPGQFTVNASGSPKTFDTSGTQPQNFYVTISHGNLAPVSTPAISISVSSNNTLVVGDLTFITTGHFTNTNGVSTTTSPVTVRVTSQNTVALLTLSGTTTINPVAGTISSTGVMSTALTGSTLILRDAGLPSNTPIASLTSGLTLDNAVPFAVAGSNFTYSSLKLVNNAIQFQGTITLASGLQIPVSGVNVVTLDATGANLPSLTVTPTGSFTVAGLTVPISGLSITYTPGQSQYSITGNANLTVPGIDQPFAVTTTGVIVGSAFQSLTFNVNTSALVRIAGATITPTAMNLAYQTANNRFNFSGSGTINIPGLGSSITVNASNGVIHTNSLQSLTLAIAGNTNLSVAGAQLRTIGALNLVYASSPTAQLSFSGNARLTVPSLASSVDVTVSNGVIHTNALQSLTLQIAAQTQLTVAGATLRPTSPLNLTYTGGTTPQLGFSGSAALSVPSVGTDIAVTASNGVIHTNALQSLTLQIAAQTQLTVAGATLRPTSPLNLTYTGGTTPQLAFSGSAALSVPSVGTDIAVTASNGVIHTNALQSLTLQIAAQTQLTVAGATLRPTSPLNLTYTGGTTPQLAFSGAATLAVSSLGTAIAGTATGVIHTNKLQSLSVAVNTNAALSVAGVTVDPENLSFVYTAANNTLDINGGAIVSIAGMSRTNNNNLATFTLVADGTIANGSLSTFSLTASDMTSFRVAGVTVDPGAVSLTYVAQGNTLTLAGNAVISISRWNNTNGSTASIGLGALGTITGGALSAFTLSGDVSPVRIANVTVDPSLFTLSYDAAENQFDASGKALVTVGDLGGSFNVGMSGIFSNNSMDSFSLAVDTKATLSVAGVTIRPQGLALNYNASGPHFGFAGAAKISAPDLGLSPISITTSGELKSDGTINSLGFALAGNTSITVAGTTVSITNPSFTFKREGALQTFDISGGASVSVGGANVSVTMGNDKNSGLSLARVGNVTALQSAYLHNGNATLTVGPVSLQASNFLFQFDATRGALTVGGTVTVTAGEFSFPSITLPAIPITGGNLADINLRLPNVSISVPAIGSISLSKVNLYAGVALPPKFGLSGLANINFMNTDFSATINALEFTLLPISTVPIMTLADISLNGTISLGSLLTVSSRALRLQYSNPNGLSLPSGSITGSVSVTTNLPGFTSNRLSATLNGDGLVIQNGSVISADLTLNGNMNYGPLAFTLTNVNAIYTPTRFTLEGLGTVNYFGLGRASLQLGTPAGPDITVPAETKTLLTGADYFHEETNTVYKPYRVQIGTLPIYRWKVDLPSYVKPSTPAIAGIVIENGILKSLDLQTSGSISVAGMTLADANLTTKFTNGVFRAHGSLTASLRNRASLSLTLGNSSTPGLVINQDGVIQSLNMTGNGWASVAGLRIEASNINVSYATVNELPTLRFSGTATANFFNLAEATITLGSGSTPGFSVTNGVIDNLDATVSMTIKEHGLWVWGTFSLKYNSGQNGGQLKTSGFATASVPVFGQFTVYLSLDLLNGKIEHFSLEANRKFNFYNMVELDGQIKFEYGRNRFYASGNLDIKIFGTSISGVNFEIAIKDGTVHNFDLSISRRFYLAGATIDLNAETRYNRDNGHLTISGSANIKTPDSWPRAIRNKDIASINAKIYLIPGSSHRSYFQGWAKVGPFNVGGTVWFDGRVELGFGDPIGIDLEPFPQIESLEDAADAYLRASNGYAHEDDVNVSNEQFAAFMHRETAANEQTQQLIQSGIATVESGAALSITNVVKQGVGSGEQEYFEFEVNLANAPTDATVSVSFATEDVTAIATAGDYTSTSGVLTWLPGDTTSRTIRVKAHPRLVADPQKLFIVRLSTASNAGIASSVGVGNILYSKFDTSTSLSLSNPNATTGQPVVYTATVSHGGAGFVRFYSNGVYLDFVPVVDGVATYNHWNITPGDHLITAEFTGWQIPGYSHLPSTSPAVLQVMRAATQTLSFAEIDDQDYGAGTILLNATTTSDLVVQYRVISGPATIDDEVLYLTGVGEIVVEAYQDGDSNYLAATPIRQTFNVFPALLTFTVDHEAISLGQSLSTVRGTYLGFVKGDDASVILTAPTLTTDRPIDGVGYYSISADGASAANYFIVYQPGVLAVTTIASTLSLESQTSNSVYGVLVTLRATITDTVDAYAPTGEIIFLDGDFIIGSAPIINGVATLSWIGTAGDHAISAAFDGDANFKPSFSAPQTYRVVKAASAITLTSDAEAVGSGEAFTITATVKSTTSGTATGEVEFRINGEVYSVANLLSGQSSITLPAGTTGVISATYLGDVNFAGASALLNQGTDLEATANLTTTGTLEFSQVVTLLADITVTDGGTPSGTVIFRHGSTVLATLPLVNGSASYSVVLPVGSQVVSIEYSGDSHYRPATTQRTLHILRAAPSLQVSATGGDYNGSSFSAVASIAGVNGQYASLLENVSPSITYQLLNAAGEVVENLGSTRPVNAGRYQATASFAGSANYAPASATATFNIARATATINVQGYTGVYDALAHGLTGTATGVTGESLSALLQLGSTFTTVFDGDVNWSFAGNTNYLSASGTARVTISQAALLIQVNNAIRGFDQPNPNFSSNVTGLQGSDTFTVSYTTEANSTSVAGQYLINATATGLALGNYTLEVISGRLTISHAYLSGSDLIVSGTSGSDMIRVTNTSTGARVILNGTNLGTFNLTGVLKVYGSDGDDHINIDNDILNTTELLGNAGNDTLRGGGGDDHLFGGTGNDELIAIRGNDFLFGGEGNDTLRAGAGQDYLEGGDGNDSLIGGSGNDTFHGGRGNDILRGGSDQDILYGDDGDDTLFGGSGGNFMAGGDGNDLIRGGNGQDVIQGGEGNDDIHGGSGDDIIDGGNGNDTIEGGSGNDVITAGNGDNSVDGGSGDDFITTGVGNDTINGSSGDDIIFAGAGNDSINGGAGTDIIIGGSGHDFIDGGASNDVLIGGTGSDTMIGGGGEDIMIAGFTSFDNNFATLSQIRDEWKSGNSYVERVAAVKLILPSSSVFDDDEQDLLTGSSGNDFFFANYVGHGVFDIITDLSRRDSLEEV